jgi:hypothetical protein
MCKLRKRQNNLKITIRKSQTSTDSNETRKTPINKSLLNNKSSDPSQMGKANCKSTIPRISMVQKFQNTKAILTLSLSFIVLNFPYFFVLFLIFLNLNSFAVENKEDLLLKIKWRTYLTNLEIFQLAYFSVTGLLLFVSGKIFRFHLRIWFRKVPFFHLKDKKPSELDDENFM